MLVLGAGIAGMVAAMELRDAGYKVQILEYNNRPGGRNWTLRGGDSFTELGGIRQDVKFSPGQYFNPGPWRLPYHHQGILHYCSRLGVELEPFTQVNYNAWVHNTKANGGKPKRYREVMADFQGHVAELLGKTMKQNALDQAVTKDDREMLAEALRRWGALDQDMKYVKGRTSARMRGALVNEGGGINSLPVYADVDSLSDILSSGMWTAVGRGQNFESQTPIFQPKGGMGMIGTAFGKELGDLIKYNCKVIDIHQDDKGVTATYIDTEKGGQPQKGDRRMVRLHHSRLHPVADPDECVGQEAGSDQPASLQRLDQDRHRDEAPLLGRGRQYLWRHELYRPAQFPDRLSAMGLFQQGAGRAAGGLYLRQGSLSLHRRNRRKSASRTRWNMARRSIPENTRPISMPAWRWAGIARPSPWAAADAGPRKAGRSTTTISVRWTGASCWRASMPRACRSGRKVRRCRRWMPSRGCIKR